MDLTPTPQQVGDARLFATLSPEQSAVLAPQLSIEPFSAGQVLVREGSYGYAFYLLRRGTVEARHDLARVGTLGPDDFFGEMAILGDGYRRATLVALEDGEAWHMHGATFRQLEQEHPEIAAVIDQAFAEHLSQLT